MSGQQWKNSTCVISGANRGIGLELTRQLLQSGATVFAGTRHPEKATELNALKRDFSERLFVLPLDVASDASVEKFAALVNVDAIDCLINNAGIYVDASEPGAGASSKPVGITSLPTARILESFDTNTIGPIRMTNRFLGRLKKAREPRIANISSVMGSIGEATGGAVAYRMSKAALNMFTKCCSIDQPDIISICLHPGWVQTDMGGKGASVKPADSASGLLREIAAATARQSGHFIRFDGVEAPW